MTKKLKVVNVVIIIPIIIITILLIVGGIKLINNNKNIAPEFIEYNSIHYQKYTEAKGDLLENAKNKTIATGYYVNGMEIYTYNSFSNLLYLKKKNGQFIIYSTTPLP